MRAAALKGTVMRAAALASFTVLYRHERHDAVTLWNEGRGTESGFQTLLLASAAALTLKLTRAAALGFVPNCLSLLTHHTTVKIHPKTDSQDPNTIYSEFRTF